MELKTTACGEHDHPEFVIEFDSDGLGDDHGTELVRTIEEMVAEGSVFRPGETFAIGWMVTRIDKAGAGLLTLSEPDLDTHPLEYSRGITNTLRHKMIQVYTADSYGIDRDDLVIPTIRQLAIACDRVPHADAVLLTRNDGTDPDDSGWLALCHDDDHDHQEESAVGVVPLHELARVRPEIVHWMMFPIGTTLLLEPGVEPVVLAGEQPLELIEGSFMDQLLRSADVK
jgi:hypothetical protein